MVNWKAKEENLYFETRINKQNLDKSKSLLLQLFLPSSWVFDSAKTIFKFCSYLLGLKFLKLY